MQKSDYVIIPQVAVHPTSINLFSTVQWHPRKPSNNRHLHLLTSDKKTHGKVSQQAKRKVSKSIDYLLFFSDNNRVCDKRSGKSYNFKISFITLTLPSTQIHSDNEIKDTCLNQLLTELRNVYHVKHYVWRAEKQKNGNIHFHILCSKFIPWSELRDRWNRITNKLGYVDRYRDQMHKFHNGSFQLRKDLVRDWSYKAQVKAYQKGKANDWNSPNSSDVHSLQRVHKVKEYITKYCTKDDKENHVDGRIWGCSYELSDIKGARCIADQSIKDEIQKILVAYPKSIYSGEYFSIIHLDVNQLQGLGCLSLYKLFCSFMLDQFSYSIQTSVSLN